MLNSAHLETFLNHLLVERGASKNTVASYRRDLSKYLVFLSKRKLDLLEVGATEIREFIAIERKSKLGESSLARCTVAIRTFHKFLAKELRISDPSLDVKPPKIPRRLPKALTVSEINALIEAAGSEGLALRDRAIIETLYATGARVSEVIALDVSDLSNIEGDNLTIRLFGKGGKERVVPIGSFARKANSDYLVRVRPTLLRNANEKALFLNHRGQRLSRQSAWSIVLKAAQRAGIEKSVSPHALRHSFATHLIDGGADIRVVQELLGHAAVTNTQIYTMITIDKVRESYATSHPRAR